VVVVVVVVVSTGSAMDAGWTTSSAMQLCNGTSTSSSSLTQDIFQPATLAHRRPAHRSQAGNRSDPNRPCSIQGGKARSPSFHVQRVALTSLPREVAARGGCTADRARAFGSERFQFGWPRPVMSITCHVTGLNVLNSWDRFHTEIRWERHDPLFDRVTDKSCHAI
jgi:hypothetical protein